MYTDDCVRERRLREGMGKALSTSPVRHLLTPFSRRSSIFRALASSLLCPMYGTAVTASGIYPPCVGTLQLYQALQAARGGRNSSVCWHTDTMDLRSNLTLINYGSVVGKTDVAQL